MYEDLKPENLLIFQNGYVKLADFGLSKNKLCGLYTNPVSLIYSAPEGFYGFQVEKSADLWSLGLLAYQLATFTLPLDMNDF